MKINDYLKALGDTVEKVANTLRLQGVKGLRASKCHCPILNGIYKACPDYWTGLRIVNGRKDGEHYHYSATLHDAQIFDPILPQPVMDLIGRFDNGEFPDLEAKSVKEVTQRIWE